MTRPQLTCPGMIGYGTPASRPWWRCTSVPQTSLAIVSSTAPPGFGRGAGIRRRSSGRAIPKYAREVRGAPKTTIAAEAVEGRVTRMRFAVENGQLIVRGKGLRPRVAIESLDFESPGGVTAMTFHGLGIWKPIVAIF